MKTIDSISGYTSSLVAEVVSGAGKFLQLALMFFCASQVIAADEQLDVLAVNGGSIEYEDSGSGEPVLMIHGTGVAATFALAMDDPALSHYRIIRIHRRGFAGSSRTPVPFSIKDHAADAAALLDALGIESAHIVGHSFGGMVTLQLAVDRPDLVHSLVVMEAPIFDTNAPPEAFLRLRDEYLDGNGSDAMNEFSSMSYGDDWRTLARRVDPNGPEQVMNDAGTVFETEVEGMISWTFGASEAAGITQPMMYVTGADGYSASLPSLQAWIDHVLDVTVIPGVGHAMLMQAPAAVAKAIAPFLQRHPMD